MNSQQFIMATAVRPMTEWQKNFLEDSDSFSPINLPVKGCDLATLADAFVKAKKTGDTSFPTGKFNGRKDCHFLGKIPNQGVDIGSKKIPNLICYFMSQQKHVNENHKMIKVLKMVFDILCGKSTHKSVLLIEQIKYHTNKTVYVDEQKAIALAVLQREARDREQSRQSVSGSNHVSSAPSSGTWGRGEKLKPVDQSSRSSKSDSRKSYSCPSESDTWNRSQKLSDRPTSTARIDRKTREKVEGILDRGTFIPPHLRKIAEVIRQERTNNPQYRTPQQSSTGRSQRSSYRPSIDSVRELHPVPEPVVESFPSLSSNNHPPVKPVHVRGAWGNVSIAVKADLTDEQKKEEKQRSINKKIELAKSMACNDDTHDDWSDDWSGDYSDNSLNDDCSF